MDCQRYKVSKTIEHDHTNALFYLWPQMSSNNMYVHFYIEQHNEFLVPLDDEASVYLNWHKDCFEISS